MIVYNWQDGRILTFGVIGKYLEEILRNIFAEEPHRIDIVRYEMAVHYYEMVMNNMIGIESETDDDYSNSEIGQILHQIRRYLLQFRLRTDKVL